VKASSRFFANRECEYYPCHKGIEDINCLFCYCPFYHRQSCPGEPTYKERDGRKIKVCTKCTFPHRADNYDLIMKMLSGK
jgi:Zn-finger protein